MQVKLEDIKKLREETAAGVADCRQALEDAGGDYGKARKLLSGRVLEKAAKKEGKATSQGIIEAYVHGGKIGVLIDLHCETDFVARTEEFKTLAHEIALQVASMNPKNVAELLKSEYIRDPTQTVESLIKRSIAKLGENIAVSRFERLALDD